ncbi:ArsR family transcriptional regulator [Streptomyces armeniacus]|uniref:ArsR family transcriptional regulator n=1 Tax=Streptomyces armeniacus TaxID=83291 RepID=A0A345XUF4_9ACTN|nr:helix-turn-helix domain-containing protein [Streptomyces armeniacus]AXK35270.1 ArsR family transcriptional regulator [Streptomyces armeniacus]
MTTNDAVLRALAHPTRLRMLSLMWAAPQSAAALARELGISHALASHHLRLLGAAGLAELDGTRTRRGGVERRYRTVHGTPLSDQGERDGTALLSETLAHNLRERAARHAPGSPGVTADAELWLTPADWDGFRRRMAELLADLHDAAQPPHAPYTVRVGGTVMLFPLAEDDDTADHDGGGDGSGAGGGGR